MVAAADEVGQVKGSSATRTPTIGATSPPGRAPMPRRRPRRPPAVVRGTLVVASAAFRYTVCAAEVARAVWVAHADRVHVRVPRGAARSRTRLGELAALIVRADADRIAAEMARVARRQE